MPTRIDEEADAALERFVLGPSRRAGSRAAGGNARDLAGWSRQELEAHWQWSVRQLRDLLESRLSCAGSASLAGRLVLFWSEAMLQRLVDRCAALQDQHGAARYGAYRTLYCLNFAHVRHELRALRRASDTDCADPRIALQLRIPLREPDRGGGQDAGLDRLCADLMRLAGADGAASLRVLRRLVSASKTEPATDPHRVAEQLLEPLRCLPAVIWEQYCRELRIIAFAPTIRVDPAGSRVFEPSGARVRIGATALWSVETWSLRRPP
jgi:hypothetical protein